MKRIVWLWVLLCAVLSSDAAGFKLPPTKDGEPRNIIFILTDDHRFDAMGFVGHPFL